MNGSPDLASVRTVSAAGRRIIGGVNDRHLSVRILFAAGAADKIRVHEPDLIAGEQAEIFLRRVLHEVLALNPEFPAERHLAAPELRVFLIVFHRQKLRSALRIIVDHQLHRIEHRHHPAAGRLQILADAILQHRIIRDRICLRNTGQFHKPADRSRREAASAQSRDRDKPRVVPSVDNSILDQLLDISLAGDDILQIHLRELNLARRILEDPRLAHHPLIQRAVILKLERAQRMRHALEGILKRMSKVIHRVDAPFIPGVLMMQMRHAVQNRISHVDVRARHVDLRAERLRPVRKLACPHALKEVEILLHGAVPVRIVPARLRQCAAVLPDFVRRQIGDICLPLADENQRDLIHFVKIVAGIEEAVPIVRTEPLHIPLNRIDEFILLLCRIRVVKAQAELSAVFLCDSIVQQNGLGMADVKVTVRLRREAGLYMVVDPLREILVNLMFNEIPTLLVLLFRRSPAFTDLSAGSGTILSVHSVTICPAAIFLL